MKGDSVILRGLKEEDSEILCRWNFDPEVSKFFPSRLPVSQHQQKKWFEAQVLNKTKSKLVICDLQTLEPIGLLAIINIDQVNKNAELGITIGEKKYWGKQHASEALNLVIEYLFNQENFHLLYARVLENNTRALRFFEKHGFEKAGVLRDMQFQNGKYVGWVWMSIIKPDRSKPSAR